MLVIKIETVVARLCLGLECLDSFRHIHDHDDYDDDDDQEDDGPNDDAGQGQTFRLLCVVPDVLRVPLPVNCMVSL